MTMPNDIDPSANDHHTRLWDSEQVADYLGVKPETVKRHRAHGLGITPIYIAHNVVRYDPADVVAYVESRKGHHMKR